MVLISTLHRLFGWLAVVATLLLALFIRGAWNDLSHQLIRQSQRRALHRLFERQTGAAAAALSSRRRTGSLAERLRDGRF